MPAASALITIPLFSRLLVPSEFGMYSLILISISFGSLFLDEWITTSIIRFYHSFNKQKQISIYYSTLLAAFTFSFVFLLLLFFIVISFTDLLDGLYYKYYPFLLGLILLNSIFQCFKSVLRIKQLSTIFTFVTLFKTYGEIFIGLIFYYFFYKNFFSFIAGTTAALFLINLYIFLKYIKNYSLFKIKNFSTDVLIQFYKYGFPCLIGTFGTLLLFQADKYIIGFFGNYYDVGIYNVSTKIGSGLIELFIAPLILSFGPILIKNWEQFNDKKRLENRLLFFSDFMCLIIIPLYFLILIFSKDILLIFSTSDYLESANVIPVIALGKFIYGLNLLAYTGLIIAKKTNLMARNYILAAIINIYLNYIFYNNYGIYASAFIYLFSIIFLLIINVYSSKKYIVWGITTVSIFKFVIAAILMSIGIYFIKQMIVINIYYLLLLMLIGFCGYFFLLLFSKEKNVLILIKSFKGN